MAQKRKRKPLLGETPKVHRRNAERFYSYAVAAHKDAQEASTCPVALSNLASAMMWAAQAQQARMDVGSVGPHGRKNKRMNDAIDGLRKRLKKDFRGALAKCSNKYPSS